MATSVEVKSEVEASVNTRCVAIIRNIVKNEKESLALFTSLGLTARQEADKLQYDEKQARKMLVLSWRVARDYKETNEELIALFDSKQAPNVSKAMRLAYPVDAIASAELKTVLAHNEKAPKDAIGVNRMLLVARGKLTAQDAIKGVKVDRAPKASGEADKNVSPIDQFGNSFSAIVKTAIAKKVEIADLEKLAISILSEYKTKATAKS